MTLRVRNAPAVVEWCDISSTPRSFLYLPPSDTPSVQLNLHYDEQQNNASFKVRILIHLGDEATDGNREYLYLWIHPKDVILLLQDPVHHPGEAISILRGPTTCLRVVLAKPVSVVWPVDVPLPMQSRQNHQLFDALRKLARQTVLAIHVDQCHMSNPEVVQGLCRAFTNGSIKQHPRHDTLQDFYKGRGAAFVQDFSSAENNPTSPDEVDDGKCATGPPAYSDARPEPPLSLFVQQPPRKRQRVSSDPAASSGVADVCAQVLLQQKEQMEEFIHIQQTHMGKVLACLSDRVESMEGRLTRQLDNRIGKEIERVNEQERERVGSEDIRVLVEREVEDVLERSLARGREELKDSIREECLDDLKNDLEAGLVSIILPRQ